MKVIKDIARRIEEVRGDRSQREFAKDLGISHQLIANYEAGKHLPSFEVIQILTAKERVNLNWLATGEGTMRRRN